jgi:hypothetical protein
MHSKNAHLLGGIWLCGMRVIKHAQSASFSRAWMWSATVPALASTYNNTKEIHETAQTIPEGQQNDQHNHVASVSVAVHGRLGSHVEFR